MFFANPWGLLGLLALPAIVVLHLYHRRFPPRLVGGLHLWGVQQRIPIEGRRREKLPITPSLLLELLAALLATFLLSQPRFSDTEGVEHFIVVLDNSASMGAIDADDVSSCERAIAELKQRVEAATGGCRVTLIETGRRPIMLAGPAVEWTDTQSALEAWQPELPDHSPQSALDLAVQLAEDGGRVLFLTDRLPDASDAAANVVIADNVEVIAAGLPLANLAITSAHWSLDPASLAGTVFLRVANLGPRPQAVTVRGIVDQQTVFESPLALAAGQESALQAAVPGGAGELTVLLEGNDDGLAIDSSVTLIEPQLRTVQVGLDFPEDDHRRTAVQRVLAEMPIASLSGTKPDLVITATSGLPESRDDLWWLGLGPHNLPAALTETSGSENGTQQAAGPAQVTVSGPYLVDKRHPLLEGVQLDGVVWGGVRSLTVGHTPLVSCGSLPLFVQLSGTRTTAYLLNIDVRRSNLTESPDWPILLSNLVTLRQQALPGLSRWNFRVNEDVSFRVNTDLHEPLSNTAANGARTPVELTLRHRDISRPVSTLGLFELPAVEHTGVYELLHNSRTLERFAVNFFDRTESDLTRQQSGSRQPVSDDHTSFLATDTSLHSLICVALLVILGLIIADWFTVGRFSSSRTGTSGSTPANGEAAS
ncbi:MAG: vWA domain-containing protein [Planctomycetota bacterium]|jgi:hypothetical protein